MYFKKKKLKKILPYEDRSRKIIVKTCKKGFRELCL